MLPDGLRGVNPNVVPNYLSMFQTSSLSTGPLVPALHLLEFTAHITKWHSPEPFFLLHTNSLRLFG